MRNDYCKEKEKEKKKSRQQNVGRERELREEPNTANLSKWTRRHAMSRFSAF